MGWETIIGGGKKEGRSKSDFYPTPPEVTLALLKFLNLPKRTTIWEPACGQGDMVREIRRNGYDCIGSDIQNEDDFLKSDFTTCNWIITNPPFSLSVEFIQKAAEYDLPFAFLLKSQYWHAAERMELFRQIPPSYVLPLTWRPRFSEGTKPLMDVMWCVWLPFGGGQTQYIPLKKPEVK